MDKTFDELYDDFFKKNKKKSLDLPKLSINFDANKLINLLDKFAVLDNIDKDTEKSLDDSLGEPDIVEFFVEDGLYHEKRSWNTPNGVLVKLIVTDKPSKASIEKVPLEELLEIAVESENFEEAIRLQKQIKKQNKKKPK